MKPFARLWRANLPLLALHLLALPFAALPACAAASEQRAADPLTPGDHWRSLTVDGRERRYLVHVPASIGATDAAPVVLAFHGGASNAESMQRFCGLDATGDKHGFLVVYPEGTGRLASLLTFNAGNCCGYAMEQGVDDVAFTRALLDDLAVAHPIESRRVYATGMSNGGMLCYRLAAELSDRIAAIAPVSGTMGTEGAAPARPVPVLHVHGTADDFLPFAGGEGRGLTRTNFRSVNESVATWVALDGCPVEPVEVALPDAADDGMRSTRITWGPGRDGSEVVLVRIDGGGHTWPGHLQRIELLGASTQDFDVNTLIWEFFARHPRP